MSFIKILVLSWGGRRPQDAQTSLRKKQGLVCWRRAFNKQAETQALGETYLRTSQETWSLLATLYQIWGLFSACFETIPSSAGAAAPKAAPVVLFKISSSVYWPGVANICILIYLLGQHLPPNPPIGRPAGFPKE